MTDRELLADALRRIADKIEHPQENEHIEGEIKIVSLSWPHVSREAVGTVVTQLPPNESKWIFSTESMA